MTSQKPEKNTSTVNPPGLDDPAIKEQFAIDLLELQKKWPNLTPDQRVKALQAMLDKTYTAAGLPLSSVPRVRSVYIDSNEMLAFFGSLPNSNDKIMGVNSRLILQGPTISDELINLLGSVVMHEREHALQNRLVAANLASQKIDGRPITAAEITKMTTSQVTITDAQGSRTLTIPGISPVMAQQAIDDHKAGKKLTPSQVQEAKKLQESMFTSKGLTNRSKIAIIVRDKNEAYYAADKNYQEAIKRKAPAAETRKLLEIKNKAKQEADSALNDYKNIYEERKAYQTQGQMEKIIKKRQKLNPATRKKSASATKLSEIRAARNGITSSNSNDIQNATNEKIAQGTSILADIKSAMKEPEKELVAAGNTKSPIQAQR
jgi:hypothetical protein